MTGKRFLSLKSQIDTNKWINYNEFPLIIIITKHSVRTKLSIAVHFIFSAKIELGFQVSAWANLFAVQCIKCTK